MKDALAERPATEDPSEEGTWGLEGRRALQCVLQENWEKGEQSREAGRI